MLVLRVYVASLCAGVASTCESWGSTLLTYLLTTYYSLLTYLLRCGFNLRTLGQYPPPDFLSTYHSLLTYLLRCGFNLRTLGQHPPPYFLTTYYSLLTYLLRCGFNLRTLGQYPPPWRCDAETIRSRRCKLCQQPAWCDGEVTAGQGSPREGSPFRPAITTAEAWVRRFSSRETQTQQCKWKPSQTAVFIQTARLHSASLGRDRDDSSYEWNGMPTLLSSLCRSTATACSSTPACSSAAPPTLLPHLYFTLW